jgi:hypothetical protein
MIGDTHTDTQTDEMASGAMIYIPSSIKIGSGNQKLIEGGHTDSMEIT